MAYEFDGEKYKQASCHQKEWGTKIINELNLKNDSYILDLGCGDGILTQKISLLVPYGKVIGVDASTNMIKTAKVLENSNLSFTLMDINNITLKEKFDLIFSNAALHWIKDHSKLLNSCNNILNEGGLIRFNFASEGNCSNFFSVVKEVMNEPPYNKLFNNFNWPWYMPSLDDYKELISQVGQFEDIHIWEENADRYFENKESLIKWIDQPSLVPFIEFLPDNPKYDFRERVIDMMINRTLQADGTCFETFRRINIQLKKG